MTLEGRVAVVTGASRGIGQVIADKLEERGLIVARVARTLVTFQGDISCVEDVARVKQEIEAHMGPPAVLVNGAGVFGPLCRLQDSVPQQWIETQQVNVIGPYLTCRAFVGGMVEAGWGRIINLSSAASLQRPGPLNSAYGTAKVALNQLTRHLAAELEGSGVTANVMHPGEVKTTMWADIGEKATGVGRDYSDWFAWVAKTGGDPPEKAARLVLDILECDVNGRFLWIDDPLQEPLASW